MYLWIISFALIVKKSNSYPPSFYVWSDMEWHGFLWNNPPPSHTLPRPHTDLYLWSPPPRACVTLQLLCSWLQCWSVPDCWPATENNSRIWWIHYTLCQKTSQNEKSAISESIYCFEFFTLLYMNISYCHSTTALDITHWCMCSHCNWCTM